MTATLHETIRVVIVDDSATIRTMLNALFGEIPTISVCGMAENGAEAVDLVLIKRPDVVVMDMQMPLLNGLDAARRILEQWPQAHIIMNSAFGDQALMDEAAALGIAGYITKDQRPSKLVKAVLAVGSPVPDSSGNSTPGGTP